MLQWIQACSEPRKSLRKSTAQFLWSSKENTCPKMLRVGAPFWSTELWAWVQVEVLSEDYVFKKTGARKGATARGKSVEAGEIWACLKMRSIQRRWNTWRDNRESGARGENRNTKEWIQEQVKGCVTKRENRCSFVRDGEAWRWAEMEERIGKAQGEV